MSFLGKYLLETARELIGKLRVAVFGLGMAGTAILAIETWEQINALLSYEEAEATVIALERGCLADDAGRDKVNPVFKCEKKDGAKTEPFQKPYVTFEFSMPDGTLARFQRLAGEIGAPEDAFSGQHFRLMYDPASPDSVTALPGASYFSRVLPIGLGGLLLLLWLYFGSRRLLHR